MCKEKTRAFKPQQPTKKPMCPAPPPPGKQQNGFNLSKEQAGLDLYTSVKNEFATHATKAMENGFTLKEVKALAMNSIETVYITMGLAETPEKIKDIFQSE